MAQPMLSWCHFFPVLVCAGALACGCGTRASTQPSDTSSALPTSMASSEVAAGSAAPPSSIAPSAPVPRDLRFLGTVTAIDASRSGERPDRSWVVTMRVDKVLDGALPEPTFSFRVHSPSRAGLLVGGTYSVEARWTGDGYVVDEQQWRRR